LVVELDGIIERRESFQSHNSLQDAYYYLTITDGMALGLRSIEVGIAPPVVCSKVNPAEILSS